MNEITAPCPFCGTPPRVEDGEYEDNMLARLVGAELWAVECLMCEARGSVCASEGEAIRDWNASRR